MSRRARRPTSDGLAGALPDADTAMTFTYRPDGVPEVNKHPPQEGSRTTRERTSRCTRCRKPTTPRVLAKHVDNAGKAYCPHCYDHVPRYRRAKR
jgi:hypothetical protein